MKSMLMNTDFIIIHSVYTFFGTPYIYMHIIYIYKNIHIYKYLYEIFVLIYYPTAKSTFSLSPTFFPSI